MIAGLVGVVVRNVAAWSVESAEENGPPLQRAYYGGVITAIAALPAVIFGFFIFAGFYLMAQSYGTDYPAGGEVVLLGLAGFLVMGGILGHTFLRRSAEWDDTGVRFRWLTGHANLSWSDIEKVEIRPHRKHYGRIRFRDGRTFPMSAYFTGGNTLLRELSRRGVPFCKWGTSQPLDKPR